jgi:hypothetical protein
MKKTDLIRTQISQKVLIKDPGPYIRTHLGALVRSRTCSGQFSSNTYLGM